MCTLYSNLLDYWGGRSSASRMRATSSISRQKPVRIGYLNPSVIDHVIRYYTGIKHAVHIYPSACRPATTGRINACIGSSDKNLSGRASSALAAILYVRDSAVNRTSGLSFAARSSRRETCFLIPFKWGGEERPTQGLSKGDSRYDHAVFSAQFAHRRERAHTVPANQGFLKVSLDTAMLFSQPICAREERYGPPSASQPSFF